MESNSVGQHCPCLQLQTATLAQIPKENIMPPGFSLPSQLSACSRGLRSASSPAELQPLQPCWSCLVCFRVTHLLHSKSIQLPALHMAIAYTFGVTLKRCLSSRPDFLCIGWPACSMRTCQLEYLLLKHSWLEGAPERSLGTKDAHQQDLQRHSLLHCQHLERIHG